MGDITRASHLLRNSEIKGKGRAKDLSIGRTWYRGENCNFMPTKPALQGKDALERFILEGLKPKAPFIDASTRITAFGSCFASNIGKYLNDRHYNILTKRDIKAYVVACGEGMVHTYAIRQQFEWALEGARVNDELWLDKDAAAYTADEEIRETTRALFMNTDVFILTFGLSEVWYSKKTGDVFWRGVPEREFDAEKHGFRVVTTEENRANIQATYDLIRKHRPEARIIFTLSPIPLVATFRPVGCMIANSYSKASLRAAVDDVMRANVGDDRLFYWPSYEIITEFFPDPWIGDRRHPHGAVLRHIMRLFEEFYCIPSERPRPSLLHTLTDAFLATKQIAGLVRSAFLKGDRAAILAYAARIRPKQTEMAGFLEEAVDVYDPDQRHRAVAKV